jgi:hypothetical protein
MRVELAPGSTARFMLGTGDNKKAFYCRFHSQKQPLDSVSCKALTRLPSIVSTPLSAQNDADHYFDAKPSPAVWDLEGKSIEGGFRHSSFVYDNGQIADVIEEPSGPHLVRTTQSGKVEKSALPKVLGGRWIGFRAGAAVWRGPVLGNVNKSAIVVHDVGTGRGAVSGKFELDLVPTDIQLVDACRDGDVLTIAVVGAPKKGQKNAERTVAMAFRDGEGWSKAVHAKAVFADDADWEVGGWRTMGCKGKVGTLTYANGPRVGQVRCTPEGCSRKESGPIPGHDRTQKLRVGELDGKALLVRVLRSKVKLGGVSDAVVMRMAAADKLASAPDQVILGDASHLGLPHLDKSLGLIQGAGVVVLLLHSNDKVYGVRIGADAKATKLTLK